MFERVSRCPDCGLFFCSPGCLREHTKLGTCPDHADGVLPADSGVQVLGDQVLDQAAADALAQEIFRLAGEENRLLRRERDAARADLVKVTAERDERQREVDEAERVIAVAVKDCATAKRVAEVAEKCVTDLVAEHARLRQQLDELQRARLLSVVFSHHPDAPRPFALYHTGGRRAFAALGAEFPDGAVALRLVNDGGWTTKSEGGAGQFPDTEVVWLSDEIAVLADQERREEALRAGVESVAAELERGNSLIDLNPLPFRVQAAVTSLRALLDSSSTPTEQATT